jgi:hypothetical protein
MPAVDKKIKLTVLIGKNSASYEDSIKAGAIDRDDWLKDHTLDKTRNYKLPDTREGWVIGNANLIDAHFLDTNRDGFEDVVLDITDIRPKGAKIKGFGGTASGPVPLIEMLFDINDVLNAAYGKN